MLFTGNHPDIDSKYSYEGPVHSDLGEWSVYFSIPQFSEESLEVWTSMKLVLNSEVNHRANIYLSWNGYRFSRTPQSYRFILDPLYTDTFLAFCEFMKCDPVAITRELPPFDDASDCIKKELKRIGL